VAGTRPNTAALRRTDRIEPKVQDDSEAYQEYAGSQHARGVRLAAFGPTLADLRRHRRQFDALFDGGHALAVQLLEQLRLALVIRPQTQHGNADAEHDGDDGNVNRVHDLNSPLGRIERL
jgi:hypothetical protein